MSEEGLFDDKKAPGIGKWGPGKHKQQEKARHGLPDRHLYEGGTATEMTENPLYLAFVWNQHQPYYGDTQKKEFIMPWVRLHAVKDYYQMAAILKKYPRIRQTFNITPSLLEQLLGYLKGHRDYYQLAMKPVEELTFREKRFLLLHYFDIQRERVVARHPRYHELLQKQGFHREPEAFTHLPDLSPRDYLDLQVWFNLVWVDPELREGDPFLRFLLTKGHNFTEEDKQGLMEKQLEIMRKIIPLHRELQEAGQVEIMTTPYYHPILPLIIENRSVRRANPGLPLPRYFAYPEDAREQLGRAIAQYRELFGREPRGLWPPEMAVSPEVIPMLTDFGFAWTISDEGILTASLGVEVRRDEYGHALNPSVLYQPYRVATHGTEIPMIFRDHYLSDMIGFTYHDWNPVDAAENLIHRFHKIRENLQGAPGTYLVTISLDGENAWEWYHNDKKDFLNHLYHRLEQERALETVTVSEYLAAHSPRQTLKKLHSGSWVDQSMTRWIGTENKNILWNYLARVRADFENFRIRERDGEKLKKALENLYIAEGSDYPWWVDSMPYYLAAPFEALFRRHLAGVYEILGREVPTFLTRSILENWPDDSPGPEPLAGPTAMVRGGGAQE